MSKSNCRALQYSDQMQCGRCGLAWDVNDPEPPECQPKPAATVQRYRGPQPQNVPKTARKHLDEIAKQLGDR